MKFFSIWLLCFILFMASGCSKKEDSHGSLSFSPGETTVLTPHSDGQETLGGSPLLLDISNTDQGYFTGILEENSNKINLQVIGPDGVTYK